MLRIRTSTVTVAALATLTGVAGVPAVAEPAAAPAHPAAAAEAPDIDVAAVQAHLDALQQIAEQNGGNRATGTQGYRASVDYVTEQLEGAGYTVNDQRQPRCGALCPATEDMSG